MSAGDGGETIDLATESDFSVGRVQVRPSLREVEASGQREVLEPRVMQVLVALARRRDQVVTRDELIETCWAGRVVGEDAIQRCIARLRRLSQSHGGFGIETIARVGYRLCEQPATDSTAAAAPDVAAEAGSRGGGGRGSKRGRWIALGAFAVVAVAAVSAFKQREAGRDDSAGTLVRIEALIAEDRYGAAFALARSLKARQGRDRDAQLAALWQEIVIPIRPRIAQSGASVYFRAYDDPDGEWIEAGTSPITQWVDAPRGVLQLKVTKPGYETGYFTVAVPGPSVETNRPKRPPFDVPDVPLELAPQGSMPRDMVRVPSTDVPVYLAGWSTDLLGSDRHAIPAFAIGRYEVSNREFKEFVDAGGYSSPEYWQDLPFMLDGRAVPWSEVRELLVDTTGRPGPAQWQLSTYPDGAEESPVGGISWYEAVAYARFRKQSLPTIHHWMRAAFSPYDPLFPTSPAIGRHSRFSAEGPVSVRSEVGVGPWGTYHMAGNVREWVANFAGGQAVALGSSWTLYASSSAMIYSADPMSRSPDQGMRLMQPLDDRPVDRRLLEPVSLVGDTGLAKREPLSDEAFAAMRFQFTMPQAAPEAVVVNQLEESSLSVTEEIVLSYPERRQTTLYIVRPKAQRGLLQPIVYSGVGDCCFVRRPNRDVLEQLQIAGFVVRAGRALVIPIWDGGYERFQPLPVGSAAHADRERSIPLEWQRDLSATIDYLETRPDIDATKIGYLGISRGATSAGAINLAIESRVAVAALASGGIWIHRPVHPMADIVNYAPRISMPVLMLSGRYDHVYPAESSQNRLFELLGTPAHRKKQIYYDTGHFTLPPNRLAADVTDWFDKYLGPVKR